MTIMRDLVSAVGQNTSIKRVPDNIGFLLAAMQKLWVYCDATRNPPFSRHASDGFRIHLFFTVDNLSSTMTCVP